ncbi:MAG: lamin tail domain-containing protein, partial [Planctomycetota bacterium]
GGVGYEIQSGYEDYITYDVQIQMYTHNDTCYIRIPFTADPAAFNILTLRVRYDDGFAAYINGVEVWSENAPGSLQWNSGATTGHSDAAAVTFQDFDISDHITDIVQGDNILAIHGLNNSGGNNNKDFLISVELLADANVAPTATECTAAFTLNKSTCVKARVLDVNEWSALNQAAFAIGPVAENLRITEIMYHPKDTGNPNDPNTEFVELKNTGPNTLNLSLTSFTKGIHFTFPDLELTTNNYVLVVKDQNAFLAEYGPDPNITIAGQYTGRLENAGERIRLQDAAGEKILDFEYNDTWRPITDGLGFSLTIIDDSNSDPNNWGEKQSWRPSAYDGGSPGWDDTGAVPNPGAVVINELMSHSHGIAPDWIELYNSTNEIINIGGWFLSDSDTNVMKYEIAEDITIDANGYIVLYEDTNFGSTSTDPGCLIPFALSETGEEVCLSSAQGGVLTGYQEVEDFGASENGVSFGRYYKSSTGNFNFVAMESNTPGWVNSYPKVGPIVFNEIMYNPQSGNQNEEYVELYNITGADVNLFDDYSNPWKFTDGISFTFPVDANIPAYGLMMVVKDPATFTSTYGSMPAGVEVLGPYAGRLSNGGEKVEIGKFGDLDEYGTPCYIRVERVNYSDGSHPENCPGGVDLWPTEPDGNGLSLTRIDPNLYGNDPNNWQAASPAPGQ